MKQKNKNSSYQVPNKKKKPRGQKMADLASNLVGSWGYILFQTLFIGVWVSLNIYGLVSGWDPYPFIFLNLALSVLSAYAAPIILMTQNREAKLDRARAINDLATDRRAERGIQDIRKTLVRLERKVDEIKRSCNP